MLLKCGSDTTCQSYVTQVFDPETGLKQGQVELRAIKLVLNELVCNPASTPLDVNVGLMLFSNTNGTAEANNTGGYIRRAVKPLDPTHCAALIGDLDLIDSKINDPDFKTSSSADYGAPRMRHSSTTAVMPTRPRRSRDGRHADGPYPLRYGPLRERQRV